MKNENKERTMRFYVDVTKVGLPFIRIDEGEFEGAIFLLDTGSTDNLVFGYAYQQAQHLLKKVEGGANLWGLDGIKSQVSLTSGKLSFVGREYDVTFLVRENDEAGKMLSKEMEFPVCGIIGTKFMAEHGWVLDFGKQEVVIPEIDVSVEVLKN